MFECEGGVQRPVSEFKMDIVGWGGEGSWVGGWVEVWGE
jgi:hypothetical protein